MTYRPYLHTKISQRKDKSVFKRNIWRTWARPVLAFLGASIVAALILTLTYTIMDYGFAKDMVSQAMFHGNLAMLVPISLMLTPFVALIAALPAMALLILANLRRWPRGIADAALGATVPAVIYGLFVASQYNTLTEGVTGLLVGLTLAPAGFLGGLAYWLLAGRPGSGTAHHSAVS